MKIAVKHDGKIKYTTICSSCNKVIYANELLDKEVNTRTLDLCSECAHAYLNKNIRYSDLLIRGI